tara:strand:- start:220 stop:405 length:186 start_codon:yes stop_codon:yes gene_type:complete
MNEKILELKEASILLMVDKEGNEMLKFEKNGDVFYKGKLIENDKQITEGFREFLKLQCFCL